MALDELVDVFLFETSQNLEQLEKIVLAHESASEFGDDAINEIFRIMHTIKGSAAMMMLEDISTLAHSLEDLFYFIREHSAERPDCSGVADLIFVSLDFIRLRLEQIKLGHEEEGDPSAIEAKIAGLLSELKGKYERPEAPGQALPRGIAPQADQAAPLAGAEQAADGNMYQARVFYEEGCQMESIRAFDLVNHLSAFCQNIFYTPDDIMENDNSASIIREKGFEIHFTTAKSYEEVEQFFLQMIFVAKVHLEEIKGNGTGAPDRQSSSGPAKADLQAQQHSEHLAAHLSPASADAYGQPMTTFINVQVAKLDKLMDLVGEMVISESMVVQNPDLQKLELENFRKAARQLHKITTELQDTVMAIRMVPLADIFQKMHRVVRDMSKKLNKEVRLEIEGQETEVDKNIIKHLSDPLMHLVRNAIDHGIEDAAERAANNKPKVGTVVLEAKNTGNDVLVTIQDDGGGLDKRKIIEKAKKNGLLKKDQAELADKEIYNLIFLPGFTTNDNITEYSGRGVGMDVVVKNIEEIGGSVSVDSTEGAGTAITIKIPLTLAIIDGMNVRVGNSCYTLPTISIKESFKPKSGDIITDPDGHEMILVRGQCYKIIRLHNHFKVNTAVTDFTQGIFIMAEQDERAACLFADELLGQQQVVVKALPKYITQANKMNGVSGCTLLGDGSISLILDVGWFVGSKN